MEIIEKAPAKINLGLNALYKRDDGYHELEMVMASVDLSDYLTLKELDEDKILVTSTNTRLPTNKKNHVYKAARLLKTEYRIKKGIHIHIEKNIPVAAGLAGGSSDAAAALRGLNRLWNLNLSLQKLAEIGEKIGSDVPYCVYGNTAFVTGRGEKMEQLKPIPCCFAILVKPPMKVSTRTIFKLLNTKKVQHPDTKKIREMVNQQNYKKMIQLMGNSLEDVTIKKYPVIQSIKECMLKQGADVALMSGSGPTVFALVKQENKAHKILNALKGFNKEVYMARVLSTSHDR